MDILGISAYYHDSAAALIRDGDIIAAAQEERFTRKKHDSSFPHYAISFCLEEGRVEIDDIDHIVFYEDPKAKFDRLITSYHLTVPRSFKSYIVSMRAWLTSKLWMEQGIAQELGVKKKIHCCDHHVSHAASAFFPSPFPKAAVITIDGVGEWSTTTYGIGERNKVYLKRHIKFPNSLGLLYSAFTYYTGFKVNSGEYKLMGLAPYGEPKYVNLIKEELVRISSDGSFIINQNYFNYVTGLTMINSKFHDLFGRPPREPETKITQFEMDIAASIQEVINESLLIMGKHVYETTGMENLVMAGGVALNCVANGLLSDSGPFKNIWIQPASGDAGGALGAALWMHYQVLGNSRNCDKPDSMQGSFLGPDIPPVSKKHDKILKESGAVWEDYDDEGLAVKIAAAINEGKIVAIARGKMEWGPRALGTRSILGDARLVHMQSRMNLKIKYRESFRPFAPMVLAETAEKYFDIKQESPYMLFVHPVKESIRKEIDNVNELFGFDLLKLQRSEIPAVTHVDYSARIQTVDKIRNPFMHKVIEQFHNLTGCSVIINTSFNVRGEPIVNSVENAYRCFMITEIDCLVIGNRFMEREQQKTKPITPEDRTSWLNKFDLD
ncbi:MAG: carbamoyltransferase [Desulfobacterales bacterium]|nr:carbamoyltransferase [Desulfobacterales bacterium]